MILVRHGQTPFNVHFGQTRTDPGIEDPGLTALGREQARVAGAVLRAHSVTRLVVSPYRRALETAELILESVDVPVRIEPLVRERYYFTCDIGSAPRDLASRWPQFTFDHLDDPWWPGEEEHEHEVDRRSVLFAERAEAEGTDGLAVVSHWGFIRALTGHAAKNGEIVRRRHAGDGTAETLHPGHGNEAPADPKTS